MRRYMVYVDDNYHHGDESARTTLGGYDDATSAIAACKAIVDAFLAKSDLDQTADALYAAYTGFGEDPWIATEDTTCSFSAWAYAKERCSVLARRRA